MEINNEIQEVLGGIDEDKLNKDCEHLFHLETQGEQLGNKIELMKRDVKFKLEKVDRLKTHEYDPNCDYCVKNPFVVDAKKTKSELEDDKETAQHYIDELKKYQTELDTFGDMELQMQTYNDLNSTLDNLKNTQRNLT